MNATNTIRGNNASRKATLHRVAMVLLLACVTVGWQSEAPRVLLVGDSTMADKPLVGNPERGWGQLLPAFFSKDIVIENHARNGRSTKSFIQEGRWDSACARMKAGDFVLIQFGHNDSKKEDTSRFADPHGAYRENLIRMVHDVRAKNATPILLTPVSRRKFDASGELVDTHGEYPAVVREVCESEKVVLIDMHASSMAFLKKLGVEESVKRFMHIAPGKFSAVMAGKTDDTHFVSLGAEEMAQMVVDGIRTSGIPLGGYLNPASPAFWGTGKFILLDNFYNNEWKKDAAGQPVAFHYLWQDTANSGFSQLGTILARAGACVDTLKSAPTATSLARSSLYIIVDPDTPAETSFPNYIDDASASVIEEWVKGGGVLLLMGNDKGNAEFEHFNRLAERFGIHFNEDSRNRVTGSDYTTGSFGTFPDHPAFAGVKRIVMKEISTLQLKTPALPLLEEGKDVIIAYAKIGKGVVCAVGDPWFYNEYMDMRRLPAGYDNARSAENLFHWLLQQAH
jgi:lysophospholipase L1-like esterase